MRRSTNASGMDIHKESVELAGVQVAVLSSADVQIVVYV